MGPSTDASQVPSIHKNAIQDKMLAFGMVQDVDHLLDMTVFDTQVNIREEDGFEAQFPSERVVLVVHGYCGVSAMLFTIAPAALIAKDNEGE